MLHPNVKVVEIDVIHGKGMLATGLIREGEVVSRLEPDQPTKTVDEVLAMPPDEREAYTHYAYQFRENLYVHEENDERYMNHSCDPNTWWLDDDTMIARRDIQPGEEITFDYATTEITVPYAMRCRCGAEICRETVTHLDYLDETWQARFGDHLPEHTRKAIAAARTSKA